MSAPVRRPDPWLDLAPVAIVEMLTARGWPARVSAEGVSIMLSSEPDGFCVIITAGREGDAAWRAIRAAHPEGKVRGPRWREEDCSLYVVRQSREPGSAIHTCDLVPGVRVLASGVVPIPPSVSESVQKRWAPDAHAATTEACALPAWVSVLARDPDARRAAELVATRAAFAEVQPEAARAEAMKATENASTEDRPRIVVSSRVTSRDGNGAVAGALVVRSTVPDLARAGLDALRNTAWGARAFVLENSSPPCMTHVIPPGDDVESATPDHANRARVATTTRNVLRGWLSGAARWVTEGAGRSGREVHEADPPDAVVSYALESCEGMQPLRGVVEAPVMRADGSILATPGYDPATRLYASFDAAAAASMVARIPERPTQREAADALSRILALVADFPFENAAHATTWAAGFLTMLARDLFSGPAPLFLACANTPGSGKTLLTELPHIVVTGERPSMLTWTGDEMEFEKFVTTEAISGTRCIIIDNITGTFRSATLDRILTSGKHRARILGGNTKYDGSLDAVWWGSGNNIEVSNDLASRRCAPMWLVSREERPEDRTTFAANGTDGETGTAALRAKVRRERWEILADAFTILRAWHCAGRPANDLPAWGSFESWSRVIRGAIVFAGGADPGAAHAEFRDASSSDACNLRALLAAWRACSRAGVFAPQAPLARVVKALKQESANAARDQREDRGETLREALESVAGGGVARPLARGA